MTWEFSGQLSLSSLTGRWIEYQRQLGLWRGGRLCRVTGNTVWSHWHVNSRSSEMGFINCYTCYYYYYRQRVGCWGLRLTISFQLWLVKMNQLYTMTALRLLLESIYAEQMYQRLWFQTFLSTWGRSSLFANQVLFDGNRPDSTLHREVRLTRTSMKWWSSMPQLDMTSQTDAT